MALLCYNKGCGVKYDADKNKDGKILSVSVILIQTPQFGSVGLFNILFIMNVKPRWKSVCVK